MKKRLISSVLVGVLLLAFLSSCSAGERTLDVISDDYAGLTKLYSGAFDAQKASLWFTIGYTPYVNCACMITEQNGKLKVENRWRRFPESSVMTGEGGYFVGVNTKYDGWVRYYPLGSNGSGADKSMLVAAQKCLGFVKLSQTEGYMLTKPADAGYLNSTYSTYIYHLKFDGDDECWTWTQVADIQFYLMAYSYNSEDQCIYMVVSDGIYKFDLPTKTVSLLYSPGLFDYGAMNVNSIVKMNDRFYLGSSLGIYEYIPETDEEYWYPMDYEKYLG